MKIIRHQDLDSAQREAARQMLDAHERAMAEDDDGRPDDSAATWFYGCCIAGLSVWAILGWLLLTAR